MQTRKLGLRGLALAFAGVLTLGLAACDDSEGVPQVVNPTIAISPTGTVDLEVGQSFQVVANVTNGPNGNNAVTYSSSDGNVASVDASSGLVTAKAPGVATIIAQSSAVSTLRASVVVRVTEDDTTTPPPSGDSASVSIVSVVEGDNTPIDDPDDVEGTIFVRLNFEQGSADELRVIVQGSDTVVACSQVFNTASSAATSGISAAAAAAEFVCPINTARIDTITGEPTFPNGRSSIRAELLDNGTVIASATVPQQLTFGNENALNASIGVDAMESGINPTTGLVWRDGDLTVTVRPAIFTGGTTVRRVTFRLDSDDPEFDEDDFVATDSSATNGAFSVTYPAEDLAELTDSEFTVTATSVTTAGNQGPASAALTIRYDNEAPSGPAALTGEDAEGDDLDGGFIGGDFDFEAQLADDYVDNDDAEVGDPEEDTGVNDVEVRFFVGEDLGDEETAEDAMAAGTEVDSGADLEAFDGEEIDVVAVACDLLDNCLLITGFTATVDTSAPEITDIEVDGANVDSGDDIVADAGDEITVEVEDDDGNEEESGFDATPLLVSATRLYLDGDDEETDCVAFSGAGAPDATADQDDCEDDQPFNTDLSVGIDSESGYYTYTIIAEDAAGNQSEPVTLTILVDDDAPNVTDIDFAANIEGGDDEQFDATLTDNLDLEGYEFALGYEGIGRLPMNEGLVTLDDSFGSPLTVDEDVEHTVTDFIAAILISNSAGEPGDATDPDSVANADEVVFTAADQAGNFQAEADALGTVTGFTATAFDDVETFTVDAPEDEVEEGETFTFRARAVVDDEDSDSPFNRVYFYIRTDVGGGNFSFRLVGIDTSSSRSVFQTGTDQDIRFDYSVSVDPDTYGFEEGDSFDLVAVGANGTGEGLLSNIEAIDVVEP